VFDTTGQITVTVAAIIRWFKKVDKHRRIIYSGHTRFHPKSDRVEHEWSIVMPVMLIIAVFIE
jgi:hypothetical protein